jgi:hypothetical protein
MDKKTFVILFLLIVAIVGIILAVLGSKKKNDMGIRTKEGNDMMTAGIIMAILGFTLSAMIAK